MGPTLDLAALDSVLGVGVADFRDRIGGAGYGPCIDLVAPSTPESKMTLGVLTTDRTGIDGHVDGDYHETFGGTSAAAPLVAGIAGLLLSLNPELTRAELQQLLEQTADKVDTVNAGYDARGFSSRAGFGRVNARALSCPTSRSSSHRAPCTSGSRSPSRSRQARRSDSTRSPGSLTDCR